MAAFFGFDVGHLAAKWSWLPLSPFVGVGWGGAFFGVLAFGSLHVGVGVVALAPFSSLYVGVGFILGTLVV